MTILEELERLKAEEIKAAKALNAIIQQQKDLQIQLFEGRYGLKLGDKVQIYRVEGDKFPSDYIMMEYIHSGVSHAVHQVRCFMITKNGVTKAKTKIVWEYEFKKGLIKKIK